MSQIITELIKFLKNNYISVIVIACITIGFMLIYNNMKNKYVTNYELATQNYESYKNLYEGELATNNILRLHSYELSTSRDSMIMELNNFKRENEKLKKFTDPEYLAGLTQVIHDTFNIEIPVPIRMDDSIYEVTKEFNKDTKITAILSSQMVTIIPEIKNTILIELGVDRVYRNQYKNGWIRFLHFDWSKMDSYRYDIKQSNDLIKLDDVRLIKLE